MNLIVAMLLTEREKERVCACVCVFSMGKKSSLAKGEVQCLCSLAKQIFFSAFFMVSFILVTFPNTEISGLSEPLMVVRNVRLQQ